MGNSAVSVLLALCALLLSGCAASSYQGIPLRAGAADSELQALAARAMSGEKRAQLELGVRFEEGRGVPVDLDRARTLYLSAADNAPLATTAYVPGAGGGAGSTTTFYSASPGGMPAALMRYCAIRGSDPRLENACRGAPGIADLSILLSYEVNFAECARENGLLRNNWYPYRQVRECILRTSADLVCGPALQDAYQVVAALAELEPQLAGVRPALHALRTQCGFSAERAEALTAAVQQNDPGPAPGFVGTLLERRRGYYRDVLETRMSGSAAILMCREHWRSRGYRLTPIEDLLCESFRSRR